MKKNIIGREREKKKLEEIFASKRSEFVAVYGRRRVGKTFLIRFLFCPQRHYTDYLRFGYFVDYQ
ncbi:MAG: ATP-binding protein [Tannerella sp.]|jgi:predicted AAA+ superfamily ATPase|nr:ATP-binding protein [Tannerella sp.]